MTKINIKISISFKRFSQSPCINFLIILSKNKIKKKKIKIGNILHQKIPFRIETNNFKNL